MKTDYNVTLQHEDDPSSTYVQRVLASSPEEACKLTNRYLNQREAFEWIVMSAELAPR